MPKTRAKKNIALVLDETGRAGTAAKKLKALLLKTMDILQLHSKEVSLALVSDRSIQRLNQKYRNMNRPTDVLAFSQSGNSDVLGDVVVSIQTAGKQAKQAGKTEMEELTMLTIHGVLHLLGYDHESPREAKKMFSLQEKLLKNAFPR